MPVVASLTGRRLLVFALSASALVVIVGALVREIVLPRSELFVESRYNTYSEVTRSELQTKGWLPGFLPISSIDIHEVHDLDTNMSWGSFRFDPADDSRIRASLTMVAEPYLVRIPRPPYPDWPIEIAGEICSGRLGHYGIELARYEDTPREGIRRSFLVALMRAPSRAAYWSADHDSVVTGNCPN